MNGVKRGNLRIGGPDDAVEGSGSVAIAPVVEARWPGTVEMIVSALEAASGRDAYRRGRFGRRRYRVRAELRLHSDPDGAPAWILYTRDVDARGLGFITPHLLPLGYGGTLRLETPAGTMVRIACTLLRCREIFRGWYDGALYFNRPHPDFAA